MMRSLSLCVLSLVSMLGLALSAAAVPNGFVVTMTAEDLSGTPLGYYDLEGLQSLGIVGESSDPSAASETLYLTQEGNFGVWSVPEWESTVKEDPFITNNFTVVNNTGVTTVFTFSVSAPIPSFNANQIIDSNILLQINDANNAGGATAMTTGGIDLYRGTVNGSSVLSLLDDPYLITCANPADCSPPGVANGQDGDEVVSMAFGPVSATEIGIIIRFSLTNGDSASVNSRFEITQVVPEPRTALLLGLGLVSLAVVRRRF